MNPTAATSMVGGLRVPNRPGDGRNGGKSSDAFRRALQQQTQPQAEEATLADAPKPSDLQPKGLPRRRTESNTAQHVDVIA
ncbi:MAG: hypothetical protein EXS02_11705 [Planctomycetes bacterium]|nr:hypothetical protein [Planctomycetota bacterium]